LWRTRNRKPPWTDLQVGRCGLGWFDVGLWTVWINDLAGFGDRGILPSASRTEQSATGVEGLARANGQPEAIDETGVPGTGSDDGELFFLPCVRCGSPPRSWGLELPPPPSWRPLAVGLWTVWIRGLAGFGRRGILPSASRTEPTGRGRRTRESRRATGGDRRDRSSRKPGQRREAIFSP